MKFGELRAHWSWMLENMPDDEPVVFPRRAAKKRAANKEKRRRIIFDCDETTYSEFHTGRERILKVLSDNPTLYGTWLCEIQDSWSDEMIARWRDAHEQEDKPY